MKYHYSGHPISGDLSDMPQWVSFFQGQKNLRKLLEIGCWEGRSSIWLIENVLKKNGGGEMYCIDPWEYVGMPESVEQNFDYNVRVATADQPDVCVHKRKGKSIYQLSRLIAEGHANSFDFLYIDGSHQAAEVLSDLAIGFELVRNGGLIVCDDYLWRVSDNPTFSPKIAVDAFASAYFDKLIQVANMPVYQAAFVKQHGRNDKAWSEEYDACLDRKPHCGATWPMPE